jgi:deoxyxylulose-5-phosphate synthase
MFTVRPAPAATSAPNLGVVELTIALHRVFSTPRSTSFVFDVAHQGYVHKMLTGRADRIHTIRTYKGSTASCCAPNPSTIAYGAGHAGTACPPPSAWPPRATSPAATTTWSRRR